MTPGYDTFPHFPPTAYEVPIRTRFSLTGDGPPFGNTCSRCVGGRLLSQLVLLVHNEISQLRCCNGSATIYISGVGFLSGDFVRD